MRSGIGVNHLVILQRYQRGKSPAASAAQKSFFVMSLLHVGIERNPCLKVSVANVASFIFGVVGRRYSQMCDVDVPLQLTGCRVFFAAAAADKVCCSSPVSVHVLF